MRLHELQLFGAEPRAVRDRHCHYDNGSRRRCRPSSLLESRPHVARRPDLHMLRSHGRRQVHTLSEKKVCYPDDLSSAAALSAFAGISRGSRNEQFRCWDDRTTLVRNNNPGPMYERIAAADICGSCGSPPAGRYSRCQTILHERSRKSDERARWRRRSREIEALNEITRRGGVIPCYSNEKNFILDDDDEDDEEEE